MRTHTKTPPLTDPERTEYLKLKVWGLVAQQKLTEQKDPDIVRAYDIEYNRGRVGKAIRLLGPYVYLTRSRDREGVVYQVCDFEKSSKELGVAPVFKTKWQDLHDEIHTGHDINSQENLNTVGYRKITDLTTKELIYVYWHQNEYDILKLDDTHKLYPVALRDTRTKGILRAIIEHQHQKGFSKNLEKYLGLKEGTLTIKHQKYNMDVDDAYDIHVRNFCARAADLTHERYFGPTGFLKEYEYYRDYFEALTKSLHKLDDIIQAKGGHAAVTREMRQATMLELLEEAPLCINTQPKKSKEYYGQISNEDEILKRYTSVFILQNSGLYTYDDLYGSDESISYIDLGSAIKDTDEKSDHKFEPQTDKLAIIQAITQETTRCSTQMTSKTSPTT